MNKYLFYQFFYKTFFVIAIILCALSCTGKSKTASGNREITDRSGRSVVITGPINRIVSTAPSNTEIIIDLGLAGKLAAVDKYSADAAGLPDGITLIDFSYPDAEALLALKPDIIVANGHNTTVSGGDPFRLLRETGIPVAYLSMSKSVNDIYKDILFIADLLAASENGNALVASMKTEVDKLNRLTAQAKVKRSVYFELAAAPDIFTFGKDSYINDMISNINGRNIFENDNWVLSPSIEAIIERNPDVILTCVDYIEDPLGEIKSRAGFNHISAVLNNRVYQIDTNSLVRPSSRILLALNQMARSVYPELYE